MGGSIAMILTNYRLWRAITTTTLLKSGNQTPNPNEIDLSGMRAYGNSASRYKMPISTYYGGQGTFENWSLNLNLSSHIGNGTTEPTDTDYVLSSDKTTQFSNISRSFNAMADGNSFKLVHTITGTNASNNTITISEIGITKNIYVTGYPSNVFVEFLFVRSLLNEPIDVQPGRGVSITVEWVEA